MGTADTMGTPIGTLVVQNLQSLRRRNTARAGAGQLLRDGVVGDEARCAVS